MDYKLEGKGSIVHENKNTGEEEEVIRIKKILLNEFKNQTGFGTPGEDFNRLPVDVVFDGIIVEGQVLSTAFNEEHYPVGTDFSPYLMGNEKMILVLNDGRKITLNKLSFDPAISTKNGLGIKDTEIRAHLIEEGK